MVHFTVRSSIFSSLVLVFLLFDASSNASKIVEVDAICNKTSNPSFCSNILNSKPGGPKGADLVALDQYTIEVAQANFTNTINLINSLIANASNDATAKGYYQMCLEHFNDALGDIKYAGQLLMSGDYDGVSVATNYATLEVDECFTGGESPSDPPYQDPSSLPQYATVLGQVVQIIFAITDYLLEN